MSNIVYNENTGTYVAKGSSDDTTKASSSTNSNFGKSAYEIKADNIQKYRQDTNRPNYNSKVGESAQEFKTRINKDIAKRKAEEVKKIEKSNNEYLVTMQDGRSLRASEKFVQKMQNIQKQQNQTQNNNILNQVYQEKKQVSKPKNLIKKPIITEQINKSNPSKFENRIEQLKNREKNLENFKSSVYNKLNIESNPQGNFFVEVGKAFIRAPLEIASIPTLIGGRISLASEALVNSKNSRKELMLGLKETPKAISKTLNPTTPEGLVNDILIFGGVGAKIYSNVKTSIKPSIVEGEITNFNNVVKTSRKGEVAGNKIIQESISVKKNNIIETKQKTQIGSGKNEIILKENNIAGKDFSVTKETILNYKGKKISEQFTKPKNNLEIVQDIKTKKLLESKEIAKDKQSGEILKLEKQNIETLGQSKKVDEGVFFSKISKENYGSSFNKDVLTQQNIKLKEGNIQTVRLSKDKNTFIESSELIKAERIKGEISLNNGNKNNKVSYKKSESNIFLEKNKVTEKVDVTIKVNPTLKVENFKTTKGKGKEFYYKNIEFKSEAKFPFDNKKGSLNSKNEILTVKPTETQKVKVLKQNIKTNDFKSSFSDSNIRNAINKRDLSDINFKKIVNSQIKTNQQTQKNIQSVYTNKIESRINLKPKEKLNIKSIDKIKSQEKIETISKPKFNIDSKVKTQSIIKPKTSILQVSKPINSDPIKIKKPINKIPTIKQPTQPKKKNIPLINSLLYTPKINKKRSQEGGFDVFVKRKGRLVKINDRSLNRIDALNLGSRSVDRSPSASFSLSKGSIIESNKAGGRSTFNSNKFYKKGNLFIEKNKYRIDTMGEKRGITYKSRKKKRMVIL